MARRSLEADRLEDLLSGQVPPEDASRQLARLATLATTVREHTELEAPSPEFKARLRAELLATAAAAPEPTLLDRTRDRVDAATARWRHSLRVAGAAAVTATMIGTTGVAAAAQSALPGDVLYSVKGFTEDARLAFASGDLDRGRLHLAFARERLEEVEVGTDRLTPDQFVETLDRLDAEAAQGSDEMLAAAIAAADGRPILDELDAFTAEVRTRLLGIAADLPLSVRPATERSLELMRRIDLQLDGLLTSSSCEDCGGTDWLPQVVLPGDGPAVPGCEDCAGDLLLDPRRSGDADGNADAGGAEGQDTSQPGSTTDSQVRPVDPNQTDTGLPTDDPSGQLDDLGTTLGDSVDEVGDTVDDTTSQLGDTVGDVGSTVGDTVGDVGGTVGDTVGDVGSTVGDVVGGDLGDAVDDTASTIGDTVGDVGSEVGDTVGDVGGTVDDTVGDVGSLVDDLLGPSGDASEGETDGGGLFD